MLSRELLQLLTRNSCFRTVNLGRELTLDPYSGSKRIRKSDPGFLKNNSTGVFIGKEGIEVRKKKALRVKGKKHQKSSLVHTTHQVAAANNKIKVNNRHSGKLLGKLQATQASQVRAEKKRKIKK